jgi:Ca2+-binding RTX toxin-like protein
MGFDYLMENNIGIAYGAVIENAKGGEGNDRINGNQAVNHFWGNGGADTFIMD